MRGSSLLLLLTMFTRTLFPIGGSEEAKFHVLNEEIETLQEEKIQEENKTIRLSLVGDVFFNGSVEEAIRLKGPDYPYEDVKEYFLSDDITIANLETSVSKRGQPWPNKQFNFRARPEYLKNMKANGIDGVTLANNHVLDYGYEALVDTIDNLDTYGISHAGAGKNKDQALKGTVFERDGKKIGLLSFSSVVPDVAWYASKNRPGLVGAYDPHLDEVMKRIESFKKDLDFLIIGVHWGVELSDSPRDREIRVARQMLDAGGDIIMGHHPHVVQGVEVYKDKLIFYSLGNFIFGSRREETSNTMIAQIDLGQEGIEEVRVIPLKIEGGKPSKVSPASSLERLDYLNSLSKRFNTKFDKEGYLK